MGKHLFALLSVLALVGCVATLNPIQTRIGFWQFGVGQFIDTHTHLDARGYPGFPAARSLIQRGNRFGLAGAFIMLPPQPEFRHPPYDYRDMMDAVRPFPDRLGFLGGGGTLNPLIHYTPPSRVTPGIRRKFKDTAERIVRSGAVGFGEFTTLHFSFNSTHPFEETSADLPLFLLLADIAAQHNIPIDLHMEAVTYDIKTPASLLSRSSHNPPSVKENITSFERMLVHNHGTKIIWAHAGWDNIGHRTVSLMHRLLKSHPNLYMAVKFSPYGLLSNKPLDETGSLRPEWLRLIRSFPNRFVIGSDGFTPLPNHPRRRPHPRHGRIRRFLTELPTELARKVGYENAIELFNLKALGIPKVAG